MPQPTPHPPEPLLAAPPAVEPAGKAVLAPTGQVGQPSAQAGLSAEPGPDAGGHRSAQAGISAEPDPDAGGHRTSRHRTSRRDWTSRRAAGLPHRGWLIAGAAVLLAGLIVAAGLRWVPAVVPHGNQAASPPAAGLPAGQLPLAAGSAAGDGPTGEPSPTGSALPSSPVAPAVLLRIEAEDPRNTLAGSAQVRSEPGTSGGAAVAFLGVWPHGDQGTLTVPVTAPSAGRYTLNFRYLHPNGRPTRAAVVTVSGSAPVTIDVAASNVCCQAASLTITLRAGGNTITFGNPDGPAPAIDWIQVSR